MIPPINQTKIHSYNFKHYNHNPQSFKGGCGVYSLGFMEKAAHKIELCGRKCANKIADVFDKSQDSELYTEFLAVDKKSPRYIDILRTISRQYLGKKDLEVNFENDRIRNIASHNSPHIFIMNHDSQSKDPQMLAAFNALLNDEYADLGLNAICPRPKIILNEDILLSMNERRRNIFEKMGAVGIDANLKNANSSANSKAFLSLIKDFMKGQANIFIFPEGKNSIYKKRPLDEKFQLGVAELVTKLTKRLSEVRVVPLGFAYGNKSQVDSIHIGEIVTFKKDGENIISSIGNITSKFADKSYKNFFQNKSEAILTEQGVPVIGKEQERYVGGILCENLRICKEEAKNAITNVT